MGNLCGKPTPRPPTPPATVVVKEAAFVLEKDGDAKSTAGNQKRDSPAALLQSISASLHDANALHFENDKPMSPPAAEEDEQTSSDDVPLQLDSTSHVQADLPQKPRTPIVPLPQFNLPASEESASKPDIVEEDSWRTLQKAYSSKPARTATPAKSPADKAPPPNSQPSQLDTLATQLSVPGFVTVEGGEVLTLAGEQDSAPEDSAMEAGPSLSTLGAGAERVVFLET